MQTDHLGRIVDINTSDLMAGLVSPVKSTPTTLPKPLLEAMKFSSQREEKMASARKNVKVDAKEEENYVSKSSKMNGEWRDKKPKEFDHGKFADANYESTLKAYKETNVWDGSRLKLLDKTLHEATHGHSIRTHDYTVEKILLSIQQDIRSIGLGINSAMSSTDVVNALKSEAKLPERKKKSTPTEPEIPTESTPTTVPDNKNVDDRSKNVDDSLKNASKSTKESSFKNETMNLREVFGDLMRAISANKKSLKLANSEKQHLGRFIYQVKDKYSPKELEKLVKGFQNFYAMEENEKKIFISQLRKIVDTLKSDKPQAQKESLAKTQLDELINLSKKYGDKTEKWQNKLKENFDKIINFVGYLQPHKIGIGKEYSLGTAISDARDKYFRDFSKDLHATLAQSRGLEGSLYGGSAKKTIPGIGIGKYKTPDITIEGAEEAYSEFMDEIKGGKTVWTGIWTDINELAKNYRETGQSEEDIRKTILNNMKKGFNLQKEVVKISKTSLATAKLIGASAEATNEELTDWSQHLGLAIEQSMQLGRSLTQISMTTGITGDHLLSAVKSSKNFVENMRNAGTLTDTAMRNIIGISAATKKAGMDKSASSIMEALSNASSFYSADMKDQALILQAAGTIKNESIRQQVFEAIQTGTLHQNKELSRSFFEALEKFPEIMAGKPLRELDPKTLAAMNASFKFGFGRETSEITMLGKSMKEGVSGVGDKLKDLEKEIDDAKKGITILTDEELKEREKLVISLKREKEVDDMKSMITNLTEVSKMLKEDGKISLAEASKKVGERTGFTGFDFVKGAEDVINSIASKKATGPDADKVNAERDKQLDIFRKRLEEVKAGGPGAKRSARELLQDIQKFSENSEVFKRLYNLDQVTRTESKQEDIQREISAKLREGFEWITKNVPEEAYWSNLLSAIVKDMLSFGKHVVDFGISVAALKVLFGVSGKGVIGGLGAFGIAIGAAVGLINGLIETFETFSETFEDFNRLYKSGTASLADYTLATIKATLKFSMLLTPFGLLIKAIYSTCTGLARLARWFGLFSEEEDDKSKVDYLSERTPESIDRQLKTAATEYKSHEADESKYKEDLEKMPAYAHIPGSSMVSDKAKEANELLEKAKKARQNKEDALKNVQSLLKAKAKQEVSLIMFEYGGKTKDERDDIEKLLTEYSWVEGAKSSGISIDDSYINAAEENKKKLKEKYEIDADETLKKSREKRQKETVSAGKNVNLSDTFSSTFVEGGKWQEWFASQKIGDKNITAETLKTMSGQQILEFLEEKLKSGEITQAEAQTSHFREFLKKIEQRAAYEKHVAAGGTASAPKPEVVDIGGSTESTSSTPVIAAMPPEELDKLDIEKSKFDSVVIETATIKKFNGSPYHIEVMSHGETMPWTNSPKLPKVETPKITEPKSERHDFSPTTYAAPPVSPPVATGTDSFGLPVDKSGRLVMPKTAGSFSTEKDLFKTSAGGGSPRDYFDPYTEGLKHIVLPPKNKGESNYDLLSSFVPRYTNVTKNDDGSYTSSVGLFFDPDKARNKKELEDMAKLAAKVNVLNLLPKGSDFSPDYKLEYLHKNDLGQDQVIRVTATGKPEKKERKDFTEIESALIEAQKIKTAPGGVETPSLPTIKEKSIDVSTATGDISGFSSSPDIDFSGSPEINTFTPKTYAKVEYTEPTTNPLDSWQRNARMQETEPAQDNRAESIDENTEKTAKETEELRKLMQTLVTLMTSHDTSGYSEIGQTKSNVKPYSPSMYWSWALEGMNPNWGPRRPNGLVGN